MASAGVLECEFHFEHVPRSVTKLVSRSLRCVCSCRVDWLKTWTGDVAIIYEGTYTSFAILFSIRATNGNGWRIGMSTHRFMHTFNFFSWQHCDVRGIVWVCRRNERWWSCQTLDSLPSGNKWEKSHLNMFSQIQEYSRALQNHFAFQEKKNSFHMTNRCKSAVDNFWINCCDRHMENWEHVADLTSMLQTLLFTWKLPYVQQSVRTEPSVAETESLITFYFDIIVVLTSGGFHNRRQPTNPIACQ